MAQLHPEGMVCVAALFAAGCQLFGSGPVGNDREELHRQIVQEVSAPVADSVSQCRTIAFGAKPCGGPWTYLIYSTRVTDSAALARLVERYNLLDAEYNREHVLASDCAYVMRPDTTLVDGTCEAAQM